VKKQCVHFALPDMASARHRCAIALALGTGRDEISGRSIKTSGASAIAAPTFRFHFAFRLILPALFPR
jgi:hypothetical protein